MTFITNKNLFLSNEEINKGYREAKSACIVLLNPIGDGSILAITKRKDYTDIGLPGGKIEINFKEKPDNAAVRECLEETGILVDKKTLIPLQVSHARTMTAITFLAQKITGGKLLQINREGLPIWVHPTMLIKDTCSYKRYNLAVYNKLLTAKLL